MEGSELAWPHQHDPCMCQTKARSSGEEWSALGWELIHIWLLGKRAAPTASSMQGAECFFSQSAAFAQ